MTERKDLVFQVNKFLGDLHVFKTKLHNFHWNVTGEHFFTLHPMLDDIMNQVEEQIDSVAERLLMNNERPTASLDIYLKHTVIQEMESKAYTGKEVVSHVHKDFKLLLSEVNILMKLCEDVGDDETLDTLTGIAALYQKHIWMFGAWLA